MATAPPDAWATTDTDSQTGTKVTQTTFAYNLQGRLSQVVSEEFSGGQAVSRNRVTYEYDPQGFRITTLDETDAAADDVYETRLETTYLVDHHNRTGYAQTVEETTVNLVTEEIVSKKVYVIGHDEITQTTYEYDASGQVTSETTHGFLHDGHGSVRTLVDEDGLPAEVYAYSAYGDLLSIHDPQIALIGTSAAAAQTTFLHSGEHFDTKTAQQYLRARWYDPATGRFNRLDPFAGNFSDPQSLHKYLYTHGDPVNGVDPSGCWSTTQIMVGASIAGMLNALLAPRFANAPAPGESAHTEMDDPLVGALAAEVVVTPFLRVGFTFVIKPVGGWVGRRVFGKIATEAGSAVIAASGRVIFLNKIAIHLRGPLRDAAQDVFSQAARIAGKNIDDLTDDIGYTTVQGLKPFVQRINGRLVASMPQEAIEKMTQQEKLLLGLHEVVHLMDIEEMGYEAFEASWKAASREVERETEMRAWRLLVGQLGDGVSAAAERAHREFLDSI